MLTKQPEGIKDGIYFNLSNDDYHNDPALSHSGMTKVLVSWQDYWADSCHNPKKKTRKVTDAMEFGNRAGLLLLNPTLFHATYNTHGGNKLPNHKNPWIGSVEWESLNESVGGIMSEKEGREHFMDGYPEVSIFFRDPSTGIKLRVKIDYMRHFGCIDYKRIAELNNSSVGRAVKAQGLDIQNYLYLEGVKAARLMLKAMTIEELAALAKRENVAEDWLVDFRDDTDLWFKFLFQRTTSPYIAEFRHLEPEVLTEGANATFWAIKRYIAGLEEFGLGRPPLLTSKRSKPISQYHVPRRDYDFDQP